MKKQQIIKNLIDGAVEKYKETLDLASGKHLNLTKETTKRFVAMNMLDWFVSEVSPSAIAEYHELRNKENEKSR